MDAIAARPRHRFTVADYYRMADAGILGEDDRVELIEGEIVEMPPIGSPHAGTVDQLLDLCTRAAGSRAIVRVQGPVRLSDLSEAVPDLMLLRPRRDFYRRSHPGTADVVLLVEVADTSVAFDRTVKLRLYARAGIREYWIVDLPEGVVEVHRSPAGDAYHDRQEFRPGDRVAPEALPDALIGVAEILGTG